MLKAMAHALTQRPAVRGPLVPLVISLVAQIAALVLPLAPARAGYVFPGSQLSGRSRDLTPANSCRSVK